MLVLSRRVGESVFVGPGVTVRVIETKGNRVSLAINAPSDVRITRGELVADSEKDRVAPVRSTLGNLSLIDVATRPVSFPI